jgi:proteic killer suppression protein
MTLSITFRKSKLEKHCSKFRKAVHDLGARRAEILFQHLADLRAAEVLEDIRNLPGDCHEYKYTEDYVLSLDLDGPNRLLFCAINDPIPVLADGISLDWSRVTEVEIIFIGDPHGKRKK